MNKPCSDVVEVLNYVFIKERKLIGSMSAVYNYSLNSSPNEFFFVIAKYSTPPLLNRSISPCIADKINVY